MGLWNDRLAAKRLAVLAAQKRGSLKQDSRAFKPASPGKKPTAPHAGETQGTISGYFPHLPVRLPSPNPVAFVQAFRLVC